MAFVSDKRRPPNIWVIAKWDAFMLRLDKVSTSPYLARMFAADEVVAVDLFFLNNTRRLHRVEFDSASDMRCALGNIIKENL